MSDLKPSEKKIMELLRSTKKEMSISEIASALKMHVSNVSRYVSSLEKKKLIKSNKISKQKIIGLPSASSIDNCKQSRELQATNNNDEKLHQIELQSEKTIKVSFTISGEAKYILDVASIKLGLSRSEIVDKLIKALILGMIFNKIPDNINERVELIKLEEEVKEMDVKMRLIKIREERERIRLQYENLKKVEKMREEERRKQEEFERMYEGKSFAEIFPIDEENE